MDVGEFIVPIPYVKQVKVITCFSFSYSLVDHLKIYPLPNPGVLFSVLYLLSGVEISKFMNGSGPNLFNIVKLSTAGGRLIIASDGIWDAVSSDMAAKSCRGLPAELAARQVVKVVEFTRIFASITSV